MISVTMELVKYHSNRCGMVKVDEKQQGSLARWRMHLSVRLKFNGMDILVGNLGEA